MRSLRWALLGGHWFILLQLLGSISCGRAYSRWSESARLGTTKDKRKIGKMLFPLHRKATISPSAASKVLVRLEFRPLRTCRV